MIPFLSFALLIHEPIPISVPVSVSKNVPVTCMGAEPENIRICLTEKDEIWIYGAENYIQCLWKSGASNRLPPLCQDLARIIIERQLKGWREDHSK